MSHSHSHAPVTGVRLWLSLALTLLFVAGELVAGILSHSLALLSDSGHNFADALALLLSWYALKIAEKPSNPEKTFGYHRGGILAALVNAASLVVIALLIFWEAFQRVRHPEPVHSGPMIGMALGAILINSVIALGLRGEAGHDLNIRSAYLHMAGDAVSALGVVVAGVIVAFTGASIADPAVSFLIGGLILWSSWGILIEALNVLMEGAPPDCNMKELEHAVRSVPGVIDLHDLHVWTVGSGILACSCHLLIREQSIREGQQVLRAAATMLRERYRIGHSTIQVEVEGCEPDDMYCTMRAAQHSHEQGENDCRQ